MPECSAKLDRSPPFFRLRMDLTGDPCTENLVLLFQKLDILRQLVIGAGCDQGQQRVETLGHRGLFRMSDERRCSKFVVPRFKHGQTPTFDDFSREFRSSLRWRQWPLKASGRRSLASRFLVQSRSCCDSPFRSNPETIPSLTRDSDSKATYCRSQVKKNP